MNVMHYSLKAYKSHKSFRLSLGEGGKCIIEWKWKEMEGRKKKGPTLQRKRNVSISCSIFFICHFPSFSSSSKKKPLDRVREFNRGIKEGTEEEG